MFSREFWPESNHTLRGVDSFGNNMYMSEPFERYSFTQRKNKALPRAPVRCLHYETIEKNVIFLKGLNLSLVMQGWIESKKCFTSMRERRNNCAGMYLELLAILLKE